jgi:hypothetical protein
MHTKLHNLLDRVTDERSVNQDDTEIDDNLGSMEYMKAVHIMK